MASTRWVLASRRVLDDQTPRDAALLIDGERIEAVLAPEQVPADVPVEDVGERVVMPGLVDSLVRLGEPGRAEWDGGAHVTRAAAAGGVTTIAELPLPSQPVTGTIEGLEAKRWALQSQLHVDTGFVAVLLSGYQDQIEPLIDAGVLAFRAYLADAGVRECRALDATDLAISMPVLERRGIPLLVHPEKSPPKNPRESRVSTADARCYDAYRASRPSRWEVDAVQQMAALCRRTGARVHLAPLASARAVDPLRGAVEEGLPISAGTAPHYLGFAAEEIPDGDPRFKVRPPIRGEEHRSGLWRALEEGLIDSIASDHASASASKRHLESGDLRRAWPGISSLQILLPAFWTKALARGVTIAGVSRYLATRPAELLGLGDRKGRLAAGYDADVVVWEPEQTFEVVGGELEHPHPHTPWAGARLFGVVHRTYLRGQRIYDRQRGFAAPSGRTITR